MNNKGRLDCAPCGDIFKHWLEFQLLDLQGTPLTGIPYRLRSRDGIIDVRGVTDGQGLLREEDLSPLPMTLHVDGQALAEQLTEKLLTENQISTQGGTHHGIQPGDVSDALPDLPGWTRENLTVSQFYPDPTFGGFQVMPSHNRRHVLEIARIVEPVFAKSCLQSAGCTDAGTDTEPHTHFGETSIFMPFSASQPQEQAQKPAQAGFFLLPQMMTQSTTSALGVGAGAAANNANNRETEGTPPLLSRNEKQVLNGAWDRAFPDYQLMSTMQTVLGVMIRGMWNGSDSDLLTRDNLTKIADVKGTAPTRVRYRFVEDARTEQLNAVGYHTSKESGLDQVKVRNMSHNKELNRYEFWADENANEPTLIWYPDNPGFIAPNSTGNQQVLDLSSRPTVLPIPEDTGIQIESYPMPEERSFRDYILVFPISNIPPIYVYLSASLKGKEATDAAKKLGYDQRIPAQKAPFNSHGQTVFFNKKTKTYITPDVDGHNVNNGWKMMDKKGKRIGTYDSELNRLKD
ncbi:S-type pyocin domain-containing protein [Xenorhabdus bovienii]|uniref:S-type pyocin domain-containing protein n=1 Tax=Xenorhabdus bovienii TaxID=40576 RepID=UPI001EDEF6A5|nr:S-type pyocin domain-containing protein [Xenorhabdus bovienii]MCG3461433.1 S-type pyocin domain-containing protein [Xenorhabdus bovienii]